MRRAQPSIGRNFGANARWGLSWTLRFYALTAAILLTFEVVAPGEISSRFGAGLSFVAGVYGTVAIAGGLLLGVLRKKLVNLGWSCFVGFAIAWLLLVPFSYMQYVRKGREHGFEIFSLATVVAAVLGLGTALHERRTNPSSHKKRGRELDGQTG